MTLITRIRCSELVLIAGDEQVNTKYNFPRKVQGEQVTYRKVRQFDDLIIGFSGMLNDNTKNMDVSVAADSSLCQNESANMSHQMMSLIDDLFNELSKSNERTEHVALCSSRDEHFTLVIDGEQRICHSVPRKDGPAINFAYGFISRYSSEYNLDAKELHRTFKEMHYDDYIDYNVSIPQIENRESRNLDGHPSLFHSIFHMVYSSHFSNEPLCSRSSREFALILTDMYDFIESFQHPPKASDRVSLWLSIRTVGKCADILAIENNGVVQVL